MNKSSFFLVLLAISLSGASFAQITLTSKEFPYAGYQQKVHSVELTPEQIPWIIFDTKQEKFEFDLSSIKPTEKGTDAYLEPDKLNGGDDISGADYGFEYFVGSAFFKNSGNEIEMVGLTPNVDFPITLAFQFDSTMTFLKAPLTFKDSSADSTTSKFSSPLVDVDAKASVSYQANGHGKLKLPGDSTFDVLRIRRALLFEAITDPLFGDPDTLEYELVTWEFYANDISSTVLRAELRFTIEDEVIIDTVGVFTFYDYALPTGIDAISHQNQGIRFNSMVSQNLNIQAQEPTSVSVLDLSGKLVAELPSPSKTASLDLSFLQAGIYVVQFSNSSEQTSKKIVKSAY